MTAAEEWRPVPGWPGYEISSLGRVVSNKRAASGRPLKGQIEDGYHRVRLYNGDRSPYLRVHTLVAAAFIGPRPEGQEVRHLDGDRLNNVVSNLAYGTRAQNMQDRIAHGRNPELNKTHCKWGHEFNEQNTLVTATQRVCRPCQRLRDQERRAAA